LVAKITPENATNKEIVWTTSDDDIAKVSSTGMVTAVSAGTVTITAASKEDQKIKAVCTITVKETTVSDISLSQRTVTLAVGQSITLKVDFYPSSANNKGLDWKTNNSSVAQVSSGGVVTAKAVGTAIVTVTSKANPSCKDTCTVYVEEALPIPTEPVYDPGVIPGAGGGDVPIVSIDETPSPSAKPTPTPSGTSSPAVTQTPTQGNDKPGSLDSFTDIKGHWAATFFEDLLQKGIVSGYPDKTLRPNAPITRAEAAVMVMKAAGFDISGNTALTCTDKDTVPDWAKAYVATAMYKGVVKGYEDGSFRPSNRLTRQETVVLVLRAFGIEEAQDKSLSFADSNTIPAWSAGYIKKAVELGIIKGYSDNTFGPTREITRAEVVTIISKCMQLKK
ncbi:MAG TPA: S-layer homology domain-containing protein, partial [Acetivibrio sp.]|nr:S-layer homology domain-containing protein [Acetivibrio sp.]